VTTTTINTSTHRPSHHNRLAGPYHRNSTPQQLIELVSHTCRDGSNRPVGVKESWGQPSRSNKTQTVTRIHYLSSCFVQATPSITRATVSLNSEQDYDSYNMCIGILCISISMLYLCPLGSHCPLAPGRVLRFLLGPR
jgi:hypothetical protein